MAGGDVDARDAAVLPHGEGQLRGGAQGLEQAGGDAVGRHDAGGGPGELVGVVAAVEAHRHAPLRGLAPLLQNDLGEGLGGVADHIQVHAVDAHAHGAPQAGGAEFQGAEEAGFDLLVVPGDGRKLGVLRGGQNGTVQPGFVDFLVAHFNGLLF